MVSSQNNDPCSSSGLGGKSQPAGRSEIRVLRRNIPQNHGQTAGFERLFHRPQHGHGTRQTEGEKAFPGHAQGHHAMTEAMAILPLLCFEATPQHRTAFTCISKAAHRQRQSKAASGGKVAIGRRRHVMQPGRGKTVWRKGAVDRRKAKRPGCDLAGAGAAHGTGGRPLPLSQAGEVFAQARDQGAGLGPVR